MKVPNFLKLCALLALPCELWAIPLADPHEAKCGHVNCQAGEKCQTVGSKPMCVGPSDGTCSISASNHKTFDGLRYDFKGSCTYTIAKACDNKNNEPVFDINARNRGNSQDFSLDDITAEFAYPQKSYVINMQRNGNVKVNNESRVGDFTLSNEIHILKSKSKLVISVDFGLMVIVDGDSTLKVTMPSSYSQNVVGMCGNHNGNPFDDLATPSSTQADSPDDFGNSWKVNDGENSSCKD